MFPCHSSAFFDHITHMTFRFVNHCNPRRILSCLIWSTYKCQTYMMCAQVYSGMEINIEQMLIQWHRLTMLTAQEMLCMSQMVWPHEGAWQTQQVVYSTTTRTLRAWAVMICRVERYKMPYLRHLCYPKCPNHHNPTNHHLNWWLMMRCIFH